MDGWKAGTRWLKGAVRKGGARTVKKLIAESAMRIKVSWVIALAFWPVPSQAAEQGGGVEPNIDCRTAYATPAGEICAIRDLRAAEFSLIDAYQAEVAFIDKATVPPDVQAKWHAALVEAQRRWIGFRDAECVLTSYEWYGGLGIVRRLSLRKIAARH